MSNGTPHNPFSTPDPVSREQLLAYAEGRLSPAEMRAVEQHLEDDPLLQDAVDGLQMPGAIQGFNSLQQARPASTQRGGLSNLLMGAVVLGVVLLAGGWLVLSSVLEEQAVDTPLPEASTPLVDNGNNTTQQHSPLAAEEIATAVEQPETLRIGHGPNERHAKAMEEHVAVVREPAVPRLNSTTPSIQDARNSAERTPRSAGKISRKLHFLHGMKLIHPQELYPYEPRVALEDLHVAASYADRDAQRTERAPVITLAYLDFMDQALGRFVKNDHKGCLEELRFLLTQYPDDVNALFYAGLCSYNLGLHARARSFLQRAATHPVNVFDEEATWYHALTLERAGEVEAAREAFERIVAGNGFYSERAQARLRRE